MITTCLGFKSLVFSFSEAFATRRSPRPSGTPARRDCFRLLQSLIQATSGFDSFCKHGSWTSRVVIRRHCCRAVVSHMKTVDRVHPGPFACFFHGGFHPLLRILRSLGGLLSLELKWAITGLRRVRTLPAEILWVVLRVIKGFPRERLSGATHMGGKGACRHPQPAASLPQHGRPPVRVCLAWRSAVLLPLP